MGFVLISEGVVGSCFKNEMYLAYSCSLCSHSFESTSYQVFLMGQFWGLRVFFCFFLFSLSSSYFLRTQFLSFYFNTHQSLCLWHCLRAEWGEFTSLLWLKVYDHSNKQVVGKTLRNTTSSMQNEFHIRTVVRCMGTHTQPKY